MSPFTAAEELGRRERSSRPLMAKDKRKPSRPHDAATMRALIRCAKGGVAPRRISEIVALDEKHRAARLVRALSRAKKPFRPRRPHRKWYEIPDPTVPPGRRPRSKAAEWRHLSEHMLVQFAHFALIERGKCAAFNILLNQSAIDEIEKRGKIRSSNSKRYISKRIWEGLNKHYGHYLDFWFVIEVSSKRKNDIHLHGEVDLSKIGYDKSLFKIIRKSLGELITSGRKSRQTWNSPDPDDGHVSYALKDKDNAALMRKISDMRSGVKTESWMHDRIFISRVLNADTRDLYESIRSHVTLP